MDAVRLVILALLFGGLVAAWFWSRHQARRNGARAKRSGIDLKIAQKRWLDQKTGVCVVEAQGQSFLLAYTVGGSVSWQPLAARPAEPDADAAPELETPRREDFERLLAQADRL